MSDAPIQGIKGKRLGVLVRNNNHLDQVIKLTEAAQGLEVEVEIFFTGKGVLLTQEPEFSRLVGRASRLSVCDVSFRSLGLSGEVPGVGFKDFATQARNAEMVEECEKYLVF